MWLDSLSKIEEKIEASELHGLEVPDSRHTKSQLILRRGSVIRSLIASTSLLLVGLLLAPYLFLKNPDRSLSFFHEIVKEQLPHASNLNHPFSSLRGPHITTNFPDPCVIYHEGTTYAFGTNNRKIGPGLVHVQIAVSTDNITWYPQPHLDALPNVAPWQTGRAVWAPDVKHLPGGRFLLYYTDSLVKDPEKHCIGAAISDSITGPYEPLPRPLICPHGGAIDPAGFFDRSTGKRYIVYKIDGNSLGHGGSCRNDVLPIVPTPLMLQEVAQDGYSFIGPPTKILDRSALDGPLVEAPAMYLSAEGVYFLFFGSNCFTTPMYHTQYATATNITGPYIRASRPLLITGDGTDSGFGLVGPGGLDIIHHNYGDMWKEGLHDIPQHEKFNLEENGHMVVFHGQLMHHNTPQVMVDQDYSKAPRVYGVPVPDPHMPFVRGMYSATVYFQGRLATLKTGGFRDANRHGNEE